MASSEWMCARCGGSAEDELGLLDHEQWCLGDGLANVQLLAEVAEREGELTQEALVAAARHKRKVVGKKVEGRR
jgi:hypothetical protein